VLEDPAVVVVDGHSSRPGDRAPRTSTGSRASRRDRSRSRSATSPGLFWTTSDTAFTAARRSIFAARHQGPFGGSSLTHAAVGLAGRFGPPASTGGRRCVEPRDLLADRATAGLRSAVRGGPERSVSKTARVLLSLRSAALGQRCDILSPRQVHSSAFVSSVGMPERGLGGALIVSLVALRSGRYGRGCALGPHGYAGCRGSGGASGVGGNGRRLVARPT
jgi:hypothetical protein